MSFTIKDSGEQKEFAGGMVRDTAEGKLDYWRILVGPLFERWVAHVTKGAQKYPDQSPGVPNWTLAAGEEERVRFKQSALRHFLQWYRDEVDEDHASAVCFNMNGAEYVKGKTAAPKSNAPVPVIFQCTGCGRLVRERSGLWLNDNDGKRHTCGRE